jgi:hypothetical protein
MKGTKGMRKHYSIIGLIVAMVLFWCGTATAIDQSACGEKGDGWFGDENECVGRLELGELGSFDTSGNWHWNITDPNLNEDIAIDEVMGDNGKDNWISGGGLTPFKATGPIIDWAVLRNRRAPTDQYRDWSATPDSSFMLTGLEVDIMIPVVWKIYYPAGDAYWFLVEHIDNPQAIADCDAQNWEFEDGDGSPCANWHIEDKEPHWSQNPDCKVFRMDEGYKFVDPTGGVPLSQDNVASITWVREEEDDVTVGISDDAFEHMVSMKWDTGQNILQGGLDENGIIVPNESRTLYMKSFGETQCPMGVNNFILTLQDGRSTTFQREVVSDRLMPIVPATFSTTVQQDAVYTKSGKQVKGLSGQTIEIVLENMTAREIKDENGVARLLIQWAEPDLAMMFSEYMKDVRLRVHVGDGWASIPESNHIYFIWADVPVTSGSVVIPPDQYAWVKQQVLANGGTKLTISGQYREQYDGFHNRGYMGYIHFPIE